MTRISSPTTGLAGGAALVLAPVLALAIDFAPTPLRAQGLDIEKVFNCAADGPLGVQTPEQCLAARDLVFNNCTSCHTFVPIVKAQKAPDAWNAHLEAHREKVPEMSAEDYETLSDFVKAHYNETEPVPELPPELENLGTNQAA